MNKWTKEQEKILLDNYKNKTIDELAELIRLDREQIKSKAWRMGIMLKYRWSNEEDDFLKKNYLKMTYEKLGKQIGRKRSAVQHRCRKLGLIKSYSSFKKQLNSDFFSIIDTEEKAYWLGFICADGCVSFNKNTNSYNFKITLQRRDSEFLNKFIQSIEGKFELKFKTAKIKNSDKIYETCEVCFKDKKFTSDLLQYFQTNKTEYLRIPQQIPSHLIRHFIRGFSDGDGCFYVNLEKRDKSFEIVGKCYDMLKDIQDVFRENNIESRIFKKRETNYKLFIGKITELEKLHKFLYDNATIYMERKYLKSQDILKLAS